MPKKFNEKSTLMARMGFNDPDLKSQLHDDIILWLYQDKVLKEIVVKVGLVDKSFFDKIKFIGKSLEFIVEKSIDFDYSKRTYDIGFIDLAVAFYTKNPRRTLEYKGDYRRGPFFYFEVKTSYPSLGELLRQLNMYYKYLNGHFFLVGPKNKKVKEFPEILKDQGWNFVEIPEELQKINYNPQKDLSYFSEKSKY